MTVAFAGFPPAHTCEGGNSSPRISIKGLDADSLVIMVFNTSVREGASCCTWLIWNIPAMETIPAVIPHGKIARTPVSALQGINLAGEIGYTGRPCPLSGQTFRYLLPGLWP
ncbi:hypothetical protein [Methanoregula sp.]|uniref:hypothetical protein n=1 Tax=Methanoregula sp. TaxID=2052170 RepID=UPI0025D135B3|nr:hypothetical protein [Methanoregula sp.]